MSTPRHPTLISRLADRFGATASFLCAVHCALLPLVIAALPAIGLSFLANHEFERVFIAFASALAATTLIVGFRRHRRFRAFWFLVPGILLLWAGIAVDFDRSATAHAVLVSMGGTLVALSHLTNLRLAHGHVHDAACGH
jgi:MerC mercury resistance protein